MIKAAKYGPQPLEFSYREGYDHRYYFIASFIEQHLRFHHAQLSAATPWQDARRTASGHDGPGPG